ncbi:hypothetical protein HK100_010142 [Physocladia obscura]|uniref:DUF2421 domain-containing protein n=1 Tax=Physocladia obscura TaxID=109957 RepID=A0AAD5T5C7_9FUNG|nr:hypothetical protein HK100_010142 [Physocladia obscura]
MKGNETTKASYQSGHQARELLIADIKFELSAIEKKLQETSGELYYGFFDFNDYMHLHSSVKGVASVLFSIHSSLESPNSHHLMSSKEFINHIAPKTEHVWNRLNGDCATIFQEIAYKMSGDLRTQKELGKHVDLNEMFSAANLEDFRLARYLDIYSDNLNQLEPISPNLRDAWNKFLHINFFVVASTELLKEVAKLQKISLAESCNKRRLHFNMKHYIPEFFWSRKLHILPPKKSMRAIFLVVKNFLISSPSIFGFKVATALFCLNMILYSRPDIFQKWYMSGAVTVLIVAISPSVGQTVLSCPIQITATTIGYSFAFAVLSALGNESTYSIIGFAAIITVPFMYLLLFRAQFLVLGLLGLISFSSVTYFNRANPHFDPLSTYLYKLVALTAGGLSFALIFTLVIYPTQARHVLRIRIHEILYDLNTLYRVAVIRYSPKHEPASENSSTSIEIEADIIEIHDDDVIEIRNKIMMNLAGLGQLMGFAVGEPRLEGKFPISKYHKLIESMQSLLARFDCVRMSVGDKQWDKNVVHVIDSGMIPETRDNLQETTREKLIKLFIETVLRMANDAVSAQNDTFGGIIDHDKESFLAIMSTEKWMRVLGFIVSLHQVAEEVEKISIVMKSIFGEFPRISDSSYVVSMDENDGWSLQ